MFLRARRAARGLTTLISSSLSLLLAVQLYVAYILSNDPSHLENPASEAYVGSRVRCPPTPLCSTHPRAHAAHDTTHAEQRQSPAGHCLHERVQTACAALLYY